LLTININMVKYYSCELGYTPSAEYNPKTKLWEANRGLGYEIPTPTGYDFRYYCERINEFERKEYRSEYQNYRVFGSHFAKDKYNVPPTIIECDNKVKANNKGVYTERKLDGNDKLISCKAETKD